MVAERRIEKLRRRATEALRRLASRLNEPLLVATVAAVLGITLADLGLFPNASALGAIVLGVAFWIPSRKRQFLLLAVAGAFAVAHLGGLREMEKFVFADEMASGKSLRATAVGVVSSVPKIGSSGRASFFLTLREIRATGGTGTAAEQRLYVTASGDPPPSYGDLVELTGRLSPPEKPRNPGEFDFSNYLERKSVVAQLRCGALPGAKLLDTGQGNPLIAASNHARRWVGSIITRDLAYRDPDIAGVITAMTLGNRTDTPDEIIDSFRTSGTLHIFAVSGLHVGLIGIILWSLLSPWPINRRLLALAIMLTLCSYAFVTGLRPSAVRATIMACLVLTGPLLDREPRIINSLGAAGFAILAFDSNQLFLPGFQLSFAVLLALTLLHRPIFSLIEPRVSPDPFIPNSLLTKWQRRGYTGAQTIAETFSVSTAAWLGSLPLMLYHFHLVTPIAPVANLFLIPLAFLVLATALVSTLTGGIGVSSLCIILNNANFLFASTLAATAAAFANLPTPISHFYSANPNPLRPPCQITIMDLGDGGASNLISPRWGRASLIDTGHASRFKSPTSAVLHEHAGVNRLSHLLLTHPDANHISAAPDIIQSFRPRTVLLPPPNRTSSAYRTVIAALEAPPTTPKAGQILEISTHLSIEILHAPTTARLSDDASIVFMLHAHSWRILFTGDSGFLAEKSMLQASRESLPADLIIRAHHNADHTLTSAFIDAVSPRAVIATRRDYENSAPDPNIWRNALAQRDIYLFDQEDTGAITIKIHPHKLEVTSFLNDQSFSVKRAR